MGLLLEEVLKWWPLLTFFAGGMMWLGALNVMVTNAKKAMERLFDDVEKLNEYMAQQKVLNDQYKSDIIRVSESINHHLNESAKRYSDLVVRMDSLFKFLADKKE